MALIKNSIAGSIARDAVVLDLGDLQRQASVIVRHAREQAEAILAEARAERERIIAGGFEQGRAEGTSKGLEEGREQGRVQAVAAARAEHAAKLEQVEGAWSGALAEFCAQRDVLVHRATDDVLRLAISIAERVIKRAIAVDPAVVVEQLRAVLAVVVRPTELVISVHPEDRPIIQSALPGLLAFFSAVKHVELVDDAALTRGSCIARTRADADSAAAGNVGGGGIDASITTQIDRIVEAILPPPKADVSEGLRTF